MPVYKLDSTCKNIHDTDPCFGLMKYSANFYFFCFQIIPSISVYKSIMMPEYKNFYFFQKNGLFLTSASLLMLNEIYWVNFRTKLFMFFENFNSSLAGIVILNIFMWKRASVRRFPLKI